MELKKKMIRRTIGGETFLVPLGKAVYDANGLYFLTEVGAFIWELLPQVETQEQILDAVLAEYEVSEDTARADIREFMGKLEEMGIV